MAQGSVTVSLQTKLEGWKEELARLQAEAKKLKIGSQFGKDFSSALSALEKQIESVGRTMNQRLTSDSQINSFVDKVSDIDSRFRSLGQTLTGVTFDDLRPEVVTQELKNLVAEAQQARAELSQNMDGGLQSAIESSKELKTALSRMGIDPTGLGVDELKAAIDSGIDSITTKIEDEKAALVEARSAAKDYEEQLKQLGQTPITKVDDIKGLSKSLVGNAQDYGFGEQLTGNMDKLKEKLTAALEGAQKITEEKRAEISKAIENLVTSDSAEAFRANLENLKNIATSASKSLVSSMGITNLDKVIADNITGTRSETALEEGLQRLRQVLQEQGLKEDDLDKIWPKVKGLVRKEDFSGLTNVVDEALTGLRDRIQSETEKLNGEITKLKETIQKLKSEIAKDEYTKSTGTRASTELDGIIETLRAQCSDLERRVKDLENKASTEKQRIVEQTRSTGQGVADRSSKELAQDAQAARMYKDELAQVQAREQMIGKIQGVVQRWFSIYAAVRMVTNAIKSVISTVKELDKTITEIAIVTNMSQSQLWDQMPKYTQLAKQYAASISGVYQVSQLYYQQGLQMNDVMALTEQTLKMARISGLDYAQATDYMTNAVRSFKMEMTDAQTVVDVYSAIAASSATNVSELASAMSKTASSAQAVGSSFENTTAMMAVMIEATRESAENIGSAMKSIISRYGEMKADPTKLVDSEGEEMSLNKVDKALKTVGISIQNANHEFRDFDDVIMDLAEKWDTIDTNTQRYIATIMAGNRQQSRFLALVSSYDRLKELTAEAADSENASQLQFLKTLDSIDAKTQQLKTSLQTLYVNTGLEETYKSALDWLNNIVTTLTNLPRIAGLPIPAIIKIGTTFATVANVVTTIFGLMKNKVITQIKAINGEIASENGKTVNTSNSNYEQDVENYRLAAQRKIEIERAAQEQIAALRNGQQATGSIPTTSSGTGGGTGVGKTKGITKGWAITGLITNLASLFVSGIADSIDEKTQANRNKKATWTGVSSTLQGVGLGASFGGGWGALIGGGLGAIKGIFEALGIASESTAEKIQNLADAITDANNKSIISKDALKSLQDYKTKYDDLSKSQYDSVEAKQEFVDLQNEIASTYPELISRMDEEGNYVVNMTTSYERLAQAKREAYKSDLISETGAVLAGLNDVDYILSNIYGQDLTTNSSNWIGSVSAETEKLLRLDYSQDQSEAIKKIFSGRYTGTITEAQLFNNAFFTERANHLDLTNTDTFLYDGNLIENLSKKGVEVISEMYLDFIDQIKQGHDLETAQPELIKKWGDEYADIINKFDSEIYKELQQRYSIPDYQKELVHNRMSSYTTEYVNLIADAADATFDTTSTGVQKRYAKELMMDEWDTFYAENKHRRGTTENGKEVTWETLITEFYKSHEEFWFNAQKDSEILKNLNDEAETFYGEMGKHTKEDIKSLFPNWDTDPVQKARKEFFEKIFDIDWGKTIEEYQKWLGSIDTSKYTVVDWSSTFGPEFLQNIQTLYQGVLSSNNLSKNQKKGQVNQLNNVYSLIGDSRVDFKTRNTLLGKMASADFTTLHGIHAFADEVKSMDGLSADIAQQIQDNVLGLADYININFNTEMQQYLTTFTNKVADMEKDISSATKGMDFKTAAGIAAKLDKKLTDFRFEAGKYFYDNVEDIIKYYEAESNEYLDDLKAQYGKRSQGLQNYLNEDIADEQDIMLFDYKFIREAASPSAYLKEFQEALGMNYDLVVEAWEDYQKWIQTSPWIEGTGWEADTEENWLQFLKDRFLGENATDEDLANSWLGNIQYDYNYDSLSQLIARTSTDNLADALKSYEDKFKEFGVTTEQVVQYAKDYHAALANGLIDANTSFTDYIISTMDTEFAEQWESIVEESKQYAKVSAGRSLISNGQIKKFFELLEISDDAKQKAIINAAMGGDFTNLDADTQALLEPYMDLLISTFKDAKAETLNAIIDMINSNGSTKIAVTDKNREYLKELQTKGLVSSDLNLDDRSLKEVDIDIDAVKNNTATLFDLISTAYNTEKEQLEAYQKAHENLYKNNPLGNIKDLQKDGQVTFKDFTNYLTSTRGYNTADLMANNEALIKVEAANYGLTMTATGDYMITNWTAYVRQINADLQYMLTTGLTRTGEKASQADINAAKAAVNEARLGQQTAIRTAAEELVKNYQNVTTSMIESLSNATGWDYDIIAQFVKDKGDGTQYLDVGAFKSLIEGGLEGASEETRTTLLNMFSSITDDYLSNITTAVSLTSQGTTSQADITSFLEKYKQVTGQTVHNAFSYDKILDAWTLDPTVLHNYITAQAQQLVEQGLLTQTEIDDYVESQVNKTFAKAIDIESFYKENNISPNSRGSLKLIKQLENWLAATNQNVNDAVVNNWMQTIVAGGDEAVQAIKSIKGAEATTEELEAAYNASINRLRDAVEYVSAEVGDTIQGDAVAIMEAAGYTLSHLDDGSAVITAMGNMADAYNLIYTQMAFNAQSTQKELNSVYAQYLTASEQGNIDAIEAMGNAMGMTYEQFGDLLSQYGTKGFESLKYALEHSIDLGGITKLGNGKIRIENFQKFAEQMNWEVGGEEYTTAFKAYNDALIELDKKTSSEIKEEIASITDANKGDRINIARLQSALQMTDDQINIYLMGLGATVENGIMTITNTANIPEIVNRLAHQAAEAGAIIPEQMAELQDAVLSVLNKIVSAIENGISGSLSHVDLNNLQDWASSIGLGKLDFTETAEGVKLTTDAVNKLYIALKQINPQAASSLLTTIKDSKPQYENFSSVLADIAQTHESLNTALEIQNNLVGDTSGIVSRTEAYQNQLTVLNDIASSMMSTPDAFKFMDNKLPNEIQSVVNIWENGSEAMKSLKTASSKKYIGVQDWYNIIQTASGLMEAAGQEFSIKGKTAAQLMQEGLENIKVVGGKAQVDLSKSGMDFTSGIKDLKSNLTDGIRTLAKAEIEMLDAEIKVFEVLAAMEQLGDVDVNGNGIAFEIEDIFDVNRANGWTTSFEAYLKNLKNLADNSEELKEALQDFKFNGISFYELLSASWETWKKAGFTEETMSQFFAQLSTMDWSEDLSKIPEQLAQLFNGLNLPVTIDMPDGFITFGFNGQMFNIDLSDEKVAAQVQNALTDALNAMPSLRGENLKETVRNAWNLYNNKDEWENLSWDVQSSVSVAMGIASGKITTTKLDNGKWTGTYNGATFSAGTEQGVLDKIAQAMSMERDGYTFIENSTGKVEGTKTLGAMDIKVTMDSKGKKNYTVNDKSYNTEKEAIEACVKSGYASSDMGGLTYTIDNQQVHVEANSKLGIAYVVNDVTGEIKYNGRTYKSTKELYDYIQNAEPILQQGGFHNDTGTNDKGHTIYMSTKGSAEITYDTVDHTYTYKVDDITFATAKDMAEYMATKQIAEDSNQEITTNADGGKSIKFACMGYAAELNVSIDGKMEYTVKVGENSVTASSIDELKTGIATIVKLKDLDGSTVDGSGANSQATLTIDGKSILLKWNASGKVTAEAADGSSLQGEEKSALEKAATEAAKEVGAITAPTDQALNVTASSVVITLSDSPNVTLGGQSAQGGAQGGGAGGVPPVPISEVTLQPQAVKLDLSQVNAQAENQNVTTAIDVPVNLKVEPENAQNAVNTFKTAVDETTGTMKVDANPTLAEEKRKGMKQTVDNTTGTMKIDADASLADAVRRGFKETVDNTSGTVEINGANSQALQAIREVQNAINNLQGKTVTVKVTTSSEDEGEAAGNVGLAKAAGSTLMGELGPELVVSGGRYFVVGQNGPEFVDLADDAIVFNHLQTQQLLEKGMSSTRGRAVTNERVATSFATGNVSGIAMATATATLAALKRLRAMWKSLENISISDLAGKGGGGGGGGTSKDAATRKAWITEVERWYNLMQKIAQLEKDITHEEQLRTKLSSDINKNGKAYYESQKRTLQDIEQQMIAQETLNISRQEYFNQRRAALNSSLFSSLYTFDENGQLKYNDESIINGQKGGFAFLSDLMTVDDFGKPKYSAEEQYNILTAAGFGNYMKYDSSGNEITKETDSDGKEKTEQSTFYSNSVQAFWDVIDGQREEMQSLHDSIEEGENELNDLANSRNEILQEIRDNQMDVENKVLKAIEDMRQAEIDALQDERDAIEDAAKDFIDGLQNQLDREKQLYENNEDQKELTKLQRQLAILQRTGGSAASISSLQEQIATKQQDMYFDKQQEQIDAIQNASDKEIERLDAQIALMTETLEYERENGLLWQQVYTVMEGTPEAINAFIVANTEDYKGYSTLKWNEEYQKLDFQTSQWTAFRDDSNALYNIGYVAPDDAATIADAVYGHSEVAWPVFNKAMLDLYGDRWKEVSAAYKDVFMTNYAKTGDINSAAASVTEAVSGLSSSLASAVSSSSSSGSSSETPTITETTSTDTNSGSSSSGSSSSTTTKKKTKYQFTYNGTAYKDFSSSDAAAAKIEELAAADRNKKITNNMGRTEQDYWYDQISKWVSAAKSSIKTYSRGGMVDSTGFALLHAKEAVLTKQQTEVLRNKVLGSGSDSVLSIMESLRNAYMQAQNSNTELLGTSLSATQINELRDSILQSTKDSMQQLIQSMQESYNNTMTSAITYNKGPTVIIENAAVNMNVDSIANDYDAQRAGEQVMEKLLSIARKSVTTNVYRR